MAGVGGVAHVVVAAAARGGRRVDPGRPGFEGAAHGLVRARPPRHGPHVLCGGGVGVPPRRGVCARTRGWWWWWRWRRPGFRQSALPGGAEGLGWGKGGGFAGGGWDGGERRRGRGQEERHAFAGVVGDRGGAGARGRGSNGRHGQSVYASTRDEGACVCVWGGMCVAMYVTMCVSLEAGSKTVAGTSGSTTAVPLVSTPR